MATLDEILQKATDLGAKIDGLNTTVADLTAQLAAATQDQAKIDAVAAVLDADAAK